jgi:hypothetical protein
LPFSPVKTVVFTMLAGINGASDILNPEAELERTELNTHPPWDTALNTDHERTIHTSQYGSIHKSQYDSRLTTINYRWNSNKKKFLFVNNS